MVENMAMQDLTPFPHCLTSFRESSGNPSSVRTISGLLANKTPVKSWLPQGPTSVCFYQRRACTAFFRKLIRSLTTYTKIR
jgi:hypothetical protein